LAEPAGQGPNRAGGHDHHRDGQHQAPEQLLGRQVFTRRHLSLRRFGMVADAGGAEPVAADLPAERPVAGLAGQGRL